MTAHTLNIKTHKGDVPYGRVYSLHIGIYGSDNYHGLHQGFP